MPVYKSNRATGLLNKLSSLYGRKNHSGEGYGMPMPDMLGGGGIGVVREDAPPEIAEHEQEHLNTGWDSLRQQLVDQNMLALMAKPMQTAEPFEPVPPQDASIAMQRGQGHLDKYFPRKF